MKSYTDLEQSKKLAEILSLESADGFLEYHDIWSSEGDIWEGYEDYPRAEPYLEYARKENEWKEDKSDIPCWSLAALLDVLKCFEPDIMFLQRTTDERGTHLANVWGLSVESFDVDITIKDIYANNPVDACVEMILKLNELNLL